MTTDTRFAGSEKYSAFYYGVMTPPTANYQNYGPAANPHWARPLAEFIVTHGTAPVLDVGCAYGHLVREIERLGFPAFGVDWSQWATDRRVSANVSRQDARQLDFPREQFGAVVSLDVLEHFAPADTLRVIDEMLRVLKPGGLLVQLIGALFPEDESGHLSDPTHQNREPLQWYLDAFAARGAIVDTVLTGVLQTHRVFAPTDWARRIVALRRE